MFPFLLQSNTLCVFVLLHNSVPVPVGYRLLFPFCVCLSFGPLSSDFLGFDLFFSLHLILFLRSLIQFRILLLLLFTVVLLIETGRLMTCTYSCGVPGQFGHYSKFPHDKTAQVTFHPSIFYVNVQKLSHCNFLGFPH